jgi:hypothetical protein
LAAKSDSWKREEFSAGAPVAYRASFSAPQMENIRAGLVPESTEDKWFIYYQAPYLYLHRSWTGQAIYRVTLDKTSQGVVVADALCSAEVLRESTADQEASMLDFLISNLLLGEDKPFPMPSDARDLPAGAFQHVISGAVHIGSHLSLLRSRYGRVRDGGRCLCVPT